MVCHVDLTCSYSPAFTKHMDDKIPGFWPFSAIKNRSLASLNSKSKYCSISSLAFLTAIRFFNMCCLWMSMRNSRIEPSMSWSKQTLTGSAVYVFIRSMAWVMAVSCPVTSVAPYWT